MSNMITTPTAVIEAVTALLASPAVWTQGATARDSTGQPVPATHHTAVAWSLDGAVERIVGDWEDETITDDEAHRRRTLEMAVFDQIGFDPAALNDAARGFGAVAGLMQVA